MLNIMRRQAGSWIIKVLLFAIVVVFVFWGVGSFKAQKATQVADVNGEIVTYDDYREAYNRLRDQYRRMYGDAFNEAMFKGLKLNEQALNQLVNRMLMLQEAQRLKVQVTDEVLDEIIYKIPAFQKNGVFDVQQAEFVLTQSGISTAEFRSSYRQEMIIDKIRALITDGISVTDAEALEWYNWYNAEVNLSYFLFSLDHYKDISPTDEELAAYYKDNGNDYLTEPQVKVSYLFFDPNTFKDTVDISKEDIAEYYSDHPEEFKTEKTVEARHILIKVDPDADEKVVAEKKQIAEKVYKKAQAGESFEALAKEYSEGPTREQGGYLGAFKKDAMVKPFADKAFSMKAGEISEPVKTRFGWHIIKVEKVNDATEQSLETATESITKKLIDLKSKETAFKKAENLYDTVFDGDDLRTVGADHSMTVKTTDFFTRSTFQEKGITNTKLFTQTVFDLEKMSISEVLDLGNGFGLLQVVDRIESKVPEMATVIDKVRADVIEKRQDELAKADAEKCLAELQGGKSLESIATEFDTKVMETGFFKRSGAIPKIGYAPELSRAAFELHGDKVNPEQVFQGKQGWLAAQLKERKTPAEEGFSGEKASIIDRLTSQKKQTAIEQWLNDLKIRGEVKINWKMIQ